ncbi:inorganic phosphate transporter [Faecalicatena contorta]|uniref:Inorganic phosphate transporter, PiT family n=1 Tax=Faecalicatena contorta TaxID=39482 RepID=A0A316A0E1_9FIRM|nr:inorganic phosphate transporter [Faecalicatena contorta]PWJ51053.1 PiT family inorganic phosphate transporter [Faecalicatena contorta]SUQ13621.1 inorganic phosphate transporter, PiT family [Faecalicatena contorta]
MAIVILIVLLALTFDFINGFHDTANAIATAVSTKAMTLKKAILIAAVMNFFGAIVSTNVAQTIAKDIVDLAHISNGSMVMIAAILSAIIWNLATWYFGIPSSSSHALIGSLAGAALADAGASAVKMGGLGKVVLVLFISPILALTAGYIVFSIFKVVFKKANLGKANFIFRRLQIVTAAIQAFSHGTNDAQKSMGIITMALVTHGYLKEMVIPHWVQFACALAMALGTSIGGWRIIKTVGTQIMKLKPVNAVAADFSSALVIQAATHFGMPVSTTHVISSSIMGVGAANRIKGVKWSTAQKMITAWFTTIPITIIISSGIFTIFKLFL